MHSNVNTGPIFSQDKLLASSNDMRQLPASYAHRQNLHPLS